MLIACALWLGALTPLAHAAHLQPDSIVMFSSDQSGTGIYHHTAQLADLYSERSNEMTSKQSHSHRLGLVLSASGSCGNVKNLIESTFEFGVVRADIAEAIFHNPQKFGFDLRVDNLRVVGKLAPSYLHIIARKDGNPSRQLADLRDSKIGMGLPDQQVSYSARNVFEAHGLPLKSFEQHNHTVADSILRLRNGQLDAIALFDQIPSPQIDSLLREGDYELISLNSEILESVLQRFSNTTVYHSKFELMEGRGQPLMMLAIDNWLMTSATASPTDIEPLAAHFREQSRLELPASASDSAVVSTIQSSIPLHEAIRNSALRTEQTQLTQSDP